MADLAKIILPSGDEYNFKDAQAREHIQDHTNPHQVTAKQAGAISKISDYKFNNVSGWYRFLTINISAGQSRSILLLVQDTYSYSGGSASYKAIISLYITRTSSGGFSASANLLTGYGFTNDKFYYTYDSSSGNVSVYVFKNTNSNGYIGVTVLSSLNRGGSYIDLSDNFESTSIATLPEGGWYFRAMQDGAGNIIPDTYATKDELLSTVINKGAIGSSIDIDTLTVPGMWYSDTGLQTNWPNQGKPGRLVVFGSNSAYPPRKVQLVVCNTDGVDDAKFYYRIGISSGSSSPWGSWTCVATMAEFEYSTDEVSGDIATFETESAQILPSVIVDINPLQDLHDYDYPWPAGGGGKNLFLGWETVGSDYATSYRIPVDFTSNTYYTFSGLNENKPSWVFAYDNNNAFVGRTFGQYIATLTIEKTSFINGAGTKDYDSISYLILEYYTWTDITRDDVEALPTQFEIGSTATTYVPYSNICPISGWDGCTVKRVGKNLCPNEFYGYGPSTDYTITINSDGSVSLSGTYSATSNSVIRNKRFSLKAGTYILSGMLGMEWVGLSLQLLYGSTYHYAAPAGNVTFTLTEETELEVRIYVEGATAKDKQLNNYTIHPMIIRSDELDTSFVGYQNSTYSISFPSSVGTVYGGTLDVTNGVLTVDRAMIDMGTLDWNAGSGVGIFWIYSTSGIARDWVSPISNDDSVDFICSKYQAIPYNEHDAKASGIWWNIGSGAYIGFRDPNYINWTAADVKSDLSGETLIVRLKSPIIYQITPTQVTALLGQNNLLANTGNVSVVYREGKNALLRDVAYVGETLYENFNGRINDLDTSVDGLISSKIYFGKSTTAAATQTKTCSITGISSYYDGLMVRIWFTNAQSYNGTPKLNINSLGAKNINPAIRYEWNSNSIIDMVFDTTLDAWTIVRGGHATTTYYGLTKLSSSVSSTSTALAATPSAVKAAYDRANAVAADLAAVEASSTASGSYNVGQHLILDGVLYEVTVAIAAEETITPGTNVTSVTVMESMAELAGAVPQRYNASTNPTGYLTISDLPIYDGAVI